MSDIVFILKWFSELVIKTSVTESKLQFKNGMIKINDRGVNL